VTPQARPPAAAADPGRLPPTVRALGWTSFFTDLSSEAIYPLLPGFVKNLGGGGEAIGLIDGAANAVAAIVRLPSGMLSDRVGRRPLVLFGYGLSAVVRPLMALAPAGWLWERSPQGAAAAFGLTAVLSVMVCGVVLGVRRGHPARATPVSGEATQPMP